MASFYVNVPKPYVKSIEVTYNGVVTTFTENGSLSLERTGGSTISLPIKVTLFDNTTNGFTVYNYRVTAGSIRKVSNVEFMVGLPDNTSASLYLSYSPNSLFYTTIPSGVYYLSDNRQVPDYLNGESINKEVLLMFVDKALNSYYGMRIYNSDGYISSISFIDKNFKEVEVATADYHSDKLIYTDEIYRTIRVTTNWQDNGAIDKNLYNFIISTNFAVKTSDILIHLYAITIERKNVVKVRTSEILTSKFYKTSIRGTLRESTSVTHFTVTMAYPFTPDFNYVFIPALKRFYYVTDIELLKAGLYSISLSVDVLGTYQDGILELTAFVDRNEFTNNEYIVDNKCPIFLGKNYEVTVVDNELFDYPSENTGGYYVLRGTNLGYERE